jgi:hypothetical protein
VTTPYRLQWHAIANESVLELDLMGRKKGDLPGRYVSPYVRKRRNEPAVCENVNGYQEHIEPPPSLLGNGSRQGELRLPATSEPDEEDTEENGDA